MMYNYMYDYFILGKECRDSSRKNHKIRIAGKSYYFDQGNKFKWVEIQLYAMDIMEFGGYSTKNINEVEKIFNEFKNYWKEVPKNELA